MESSQSQQGSAHHEHLWSSAGGPEQHHTHATPLASAPGVPPAPGNATEIVWQWICYALWAWTLAALSIFLSGTLAYFLIKESAMHEVSAYSFAAVLVLLPMAYYVDRVYREREPVEKRGFAAVVLVVNALLVFLAVVAAAVATFLGLFWLLMNGDVSATAGTSILSSTIVTLLGVLLFARIVGFVRIARYIKFFPLAVTGVVLITAGLAIGGPIRSLVTTRTDRLVEDSIGTLNSAIQDYTLDKSKLPASLGDLPLRETYHEGAKKLVDRKLVEYTPKKNPTSSYNMEYELCVTFGRAKGNGSSQHDNIYDAAVNHGQGRQCYTTSAYGPTENTNSYGDLNYPDNPQLQEFVDTLSQ